MRYVSYAVHAPTCPTKTHMGKKILELTQREKFLIEKANQGFSMQEITILLVSEGFAPISKQRVHQLVTKARAKIKK